MFLNYPNIKADKQFVFYSNSSAPGSVADDQAYSAWTKPQGISFVHIIAIGAGGGGGNGATGASGTNRNGGGGGGPGAVVAGLFPSYLIPDSLIIKVGEGGNSTTTAGNTIIGFNIGLGRGSAVSNSISTSLIRAAGGSGGVTGGAGGASGVNSTHGNNNAPDINSLLVPTFSFTKTLTPGDSGGTGGVASTLTAGANIVSSFTTSVFVTGGAGGGAVNSSNVEKQGGTVTATGLLVANGGAGTGTPGEDGEFQWKPLSFCGGGGGGANSTGTGGKGGDGAYGCGGGGGGGGVTGGAGGRGGDGLVIINCW